ncbi:MAG: diacylglycerol kinase [Rhodobacteraceae bacterium]|jgi:diacylglycerol kinase (ATP)|nr:diacylglycerol kinase [Paracoccaceae bacterium]
MRGLLRHLLPRIGWSVAGLSACWRGERAFRLWVWVNGASLVLAFALPLDWGARGAVIGLGLVVLAIEALNTAIERTVDLAMPDRHPLAGQAKDAASAAVLLAGVAWAVVWGGVLAGWALG